jgi:hypothetical protein
MSHSGGSLCPATRNYGACRGPRQMYPNEPGLVGASSGAPDTPQVPARFCGETILAVVR